MKYFFQAIGYMIIYIPIYIVVAIIGSFLLGGVFDLLGDFSNLAVGLFIFFVLAAIFSGPYIKGDEKDYK